MGVLIAAALLNSALLFIETERTPPEMAAQVIAAEAAGEGFLAMTAVGEVIRRRGSFDGFSVMSKDLPDFFKKQGFKTRLAARTAWTLSKLRMLTGGADHFENVRRFGVPEWARGMRRTASWGGLVFYKSK